VSSLHGAARTRRGAIVALDPASPVASVILFQYNPARLRRTLEPRLGSEGGAAPEALRLAGPPYESIAIDVEIDAEAQPSTADSGTSSTGLHPQLAALEMLLYPKVVTVLGNAVLERLGVIEVVAPEAPLTLLVWGTKRVVPVRLTTFSVQEDAHDADLNPIRATVSLAMDVLTYQDLPPAGLGYGLFVAYQVAKEAMATTNGAAAALPGTASIGLTTPLPRLG
jgi:hypothetical protein